jgi:ABC-type transporter Mla subunit MlaD
MDEQRSNEPRWPIWVGIFVLLGSLATVASAFWASWLK